MLKYFLAWHFYFFSHVYAAKNKQTKKQTNQSGNGFLCTFQLPWFEVWLQMENNANDKTSVTWSVQR